MLKCALAICRKDLTLILSRNAGIMQALLLGLLLVFLFSLSLNTSDALSPQAAASMFWLATAFCQVLIFNMLYASEELCGARSGLLLLPAPVQSVWLGKSLAGLLLIMAAQCVFIPAVFVFLGQHLADGFLPALAGIVLGDLGMAVSGSLFGALAAGRSGRESLLSIILFPLLVPLLLAGVRLASLGIDPDPLPGDPLRWIGLAAAFDAVFTAAGLLLFPFVYTGDES